MTVSAEIKGDSSLGVTVEHGRNPGNYFLLEMLVFTAESKADFLITPGKGSVGVGGNRSGEEGLRTFCSVGTGSHSLR